MANFQEIEVNGLNNVIAVDFVNHKAVKSKDNSDGRPWQMCIMQFPVVPLNFAITEQIKAAEMKSRCEWVKYCLNSMCGCKSNECEREYQHLLAAVDQVMRACAKGKNAQAAKDSCIERLLSSGYFE